MIHLIDTSKSFEVKHPSGAVFVLSHWTNAMQEETDRRCLEVNPDVNGPSKFNFNTALERELKIEFSVAAWQGVMMDGEEAPCTSENKRKLPVGVQLWLQKEIEERAGLRMTPDEKKN